ncbi:MAG TPA: hypothetical protein VF785_18335 [Gemmatimonadaceae bacterium]
MRPRRSFRRAVVALVALGLVAIAPKRVRAQGPILLQGILDGEFWTTNAKSNLLTRNQGQPAGLGRLQLWGAVEPWRGLVAYAQGDIEGGSARYETTSTEVSSDQFGLRYTVSPQFVVDAGKLTPVIGTFASRHFSTRNPLIGVPDGYSLEYPYGVEVFGEAYKFDYRVAAVSRPTSHVGYEPDPTPRLRPAIGGGFTPMIGLRLGASFTVGPYLNDNVAATALKGERWTDFHQRVMAFDASFSHGYLETHAEAARGSYDIPSGKITGFTYYGEAKYTLTPRFFVAARAERNKYPFIRPTSATAPATATWSARLTDFVDGEIGGGYRLSPSTLLKASVRGDRWWVRATSPGFLGQGGHAVALQVSQAFDLADWLDRRR